MKMMEILSSYSELGFRPHFYEKHLRDCLHEKQDGIKNGTGRFYRALMEKCSGYNFSQLLQKACIV